MIKRDVVVVGAGNAALVAALAAHEAGASVIVLEAAPEHLRGGNSRFSGGIFRVAHSGLESILPLLNGRATPPTDRVQVGPYPVDQYYDDVMRAGEGRPDADLVRLLAGSSYDTMRWMKDRGVAWELSIGKLIDPALVDSETAYVLPPGGAVRSRGEGIGLMVDLYAAVEESGIEVRYGSPAASLVMEGATTRGVRVRMRDSYVDVLGSVVLACGGFESNPEMRVRYLGTGWDLVKVRGTRFNTGGMLQAALDAGASPAGHWAGCHAVPIDRDAPAMGDLQLTDRMSRYSYPFGLLVNVNGERFVDEGENHVWLTYAKTGAAILAQPNGTAFEIFDQRTIHLLEPRYVTGTPVNAGSVEELAVELGIAPSKLARTVATFNSATRASALDDFDPFDLDGVGTDGDILPPKSNWAIPIEEGPFVAYPVTCGITFTYGGLHVDTAGRVLDSQGNSMPYLYATGEITGGFFFHNYPAGAGLMRGAVLGRIAGANAAADR